MGTVGSQGCLLAAAGPGNPRGQGGMCWHLVSAKRVCHPECSISLVTGLEQAGALGCMCAHVGGTAEIGGYEPDNPKLSVLASVMWLVNGKQPLRINVFPKRGPSMLYA
jgi:hypothetical protein